MPILLPHLSSPSQAFRAAVLQVLCSFEQPALLAAASSETDTMMTGQPTDATTTKAKTPRCANTKGTPHATESL